MCEWIDSFDRFDTHSEKVSNVLNYTNLMRIQFIKSLFCVILSLSWVWGDCEEGEVELWDECYNIEETTELNLGWSGLTGQIPPRNW